MRPEELRAPVDGVIAATRVVAGQVVAPSDQLFQIIDPASLLVEALVFDQIDPDAVDEATASVGGDASGHQAQIHRPQPGAAAAILAPAVRNRRGARCALNVGAPVTVIATAGEPVTGILLPRSALAQAPNGQTVVFSHKEPEVFVPRPVRVEPFDSDNVLVTAGIAAGREDRGAQRAADQSGAVRGGRAMFNLLVTASLRNRLLVLAAASCWWPTAASCCRGCRSMCSPISTARRWC